MSISILLGWLIACKSCQPVYEFAYEAPIKKIVFNAFFPNGLIYQATPDAKIIVGKKDARPPINEAGGSDAPYFEISGFEIETGNKLWQLPFSGEIVGETAKQILVYEAKTSTVHFVTPADGQVTRKISPAPNPLTSKNSLDLGMAFTDEMYITTKALYTSIWQSDNKDDESFKIGVTAKTWKDNKTQWFVPPIKQIVIIENRPVIFGDKVFFINPPQSIDGDQTYQIVSLKTGEEIFRGKTGGKFSQFGGDLFIEQTDTFVRRFEPLTNTETWKIEGNFYHAMVWAIGNQITISTANETGVRTILLIDAITGKSISQFEFPNTNATPLKGCFLTIDKQILCNFVAESRTDIQKRDFNYWAAYDVAAKKVLWRTELNSKSESSLLPFASDKMKFE